MTPDDDDLAKRIYAALMDSSLNSVRAKKQQGFQLGVSDLGFCSERIRRTLDEQVPEDTDVLTAWIGTALGEAAEQSVAAAWDTEVVAQAEVKVTLTGEQNQYTLTGHPDLLFPVETMMLDGKTTYGLSDVERNGPNQQQQFQRHLYGLGAYANGLFPNATSPEQVTVGNFWIDRAGIDKRVHVDTEPLDMEVVREATRWLDDVVYAFVNGEEARKEPPREMCAVTCGFYRTCRAFDTDVEGLITDEVQVRNIAQYDEGREMAKAGKRLMDQAKQQVRGVEGFTDEFAVRWTHVNETVVPSFTRRGYDTLDIKRRKK